MTNPKLNYLLVLFLMAGLFFTSCSEEETVSVEEVENYTEDAVFLMQRRAKVGMRGCFEFVFPIDIVFPDETSQSVESYEELKEAIKAWKTDNPDAEDKPQLGYPLDIMTDEGEIITAESKEDLVASSKECVKDFIKKHNRLNNSCFRVQFPVDVLLPNEETVTLENRKDLKRLLRVWKENNPNLEDKPQLVFPITVKVKETEEIITLNSSEDLAALKEECRGE